MATIRTPKGNMFALHNNPIMGTFSAVGPLTGGKRVIKLDASVRLSVQEADRASARQSLLEHLISLGY